MHANNATHADRTCVATEKGSGVLGRSPEKQEVERGSAPQMPSGPRQGSASASLASAAGGIGRA